MKAVTLLMASALALAGCSRAILNPVMNEARLVNSVQPLDQFLIMQEGMVWYGNAIPKRGLLLPKGEYPLAFEDPKYWYFTAPLPIEHRQFEPDKSWFESGGLAIPKEKDQAFVYRDNGRNSLTLVWRLDKTFIKFENRIWYRGSVEAEEGNTESAIVPNHP